MIRKFCVLGSGGMGTGMALVLAEKPARQVTLWSHDANRSRDMRESRENRRYLPGVRLPENLVLTSDPGEALAGAELVVAAIPTKFLRATLQMLAPDVPAGIPVVSVIKGIENETFRRPSEIIVELLGARPVAALCGPSHAEEFSRRLPCSVVVAGGDANLLLEVQQGFSTDRFRVYTNRDLIGVELAGALKNVVAIAAGTCDGLRYGDNAKAALLTRGIVEMTRFGVALGADHETFFGLAGIGDLITTCCSGFGRNRKVGEQIGQGKSLEEAIASIHGVPEGVTTCQSVHDLSRHRNLDMPICHEVYRVLFEGKSPVAATDT
ncbi:MAG: NAD(P)-dependent glycerol-3-phosphate dehydrogenase, partial [Planctomycetaceae bacterium]